MGVTSRSHRVARPGFKLTELAAWNTTTNYLETPSFGDLPRQCSRTARETGIRRRLAVRTVIGLMVFLLVGSGVGFAQTDQPGSLNPGASENAVVSKPTAPNRESARTKPDAVDRRFNVKKTGAVVYQAAQDYQLKCDLYQPIPAKAQGKSTSLFPAIVAIHGGAWRSGSKVTMMRHANYFAKAGFVVMAINYRHAPAHRFPAQIHDCKLAVRWLKANAGKWQVDPERIGAFGYSAGGHLAALLGTTDQRADLEGEIPPELASFDSSVACVAAGGAPCEFSWIKEDSAVLKPWIGNTRREAADDYDRASPLTYVDAGNAPFYFFHGQYDLIVPLDSSLKLHEALTNAGVSSTHEVALLTGHMATFGNMLWAEKSLRFLNQHLNQNPATAKPLVND